jgi:xylulokinase
MHQNQQSPCLIGIDLGTSSVKTIVMNAQGQIITWADEEYAISTPQPGWAEQDPEIWLQATINTVRKALTASGIEPKRVTGIGLSGQMHGLVCVDAAGKVLRPAIIWADRRSQSQRLRLEQQIGLERLAAWTGNPLATGFMLPSWTWITENEPNIAASTRYLLLPKDYLRYRLTGMIGTEPSDASSTLLFDPHQRTWCLPLLEEIKLSENLLPPVSESASVAGGLRPEIASACGLPAGTPVVFGASDVSAQALGQGIMTPGVVSCTIGTGGQLFAPIANPVHDPQLRLHLFCHAIPNRWHLEAAILSAGLSLRWLRDQFWQTQSYDTLANAAQQVEAAIQGVFFLPYLVGERTPVMDPAARAAFVGLSLEHGQAHIVRAVMEGVVFALRQGLDLMSSLDVPIETLVATGGSIRHPLWLQLQANIFNRPVYPADTPQAAGCGAAFLAGVGTGLFEDIQDATRFSATSRTTVVMPDPARVEPYERAYQTYCRLYPVLKTI